MSRNRKTATTSKELLEAPKFIDSGGGIRAGGDFRLPVLGALSKRKESRNRIDMTVTSKGLSIGDPGNGKRSKEVSESLNSNNTKGSLLFSSFKQQFKES